MGKRPDLRNRLPVNDRCQQLTYHRPPTPAEVRLGYGAEHYRDFDVEDACWPGTRILKKWFVAKDDGLRYYR